MLLFYLKTFSASVLYNKSQIHCIKDMAIPNLKEVNSNSLQWTLTTGWTLTTLDNFINTLCIFIPLYFCSHCPHFLHKYFHSTWQTTYIFSRPKSKISSSSKLSLITTYFLFILYLPIRPGRIFQFVSLYLK